MKTPNADGVLGTQRTHSRESGRRRRLHRVRIHPTQLTFHMFRKINGVLCSGNNAAWTKSEDLGRGI